MNRAKSISEIYALVGNIIIETMIVGLTTGKYKIGIDSNLVKSLDYDINFQQKDIKTGRFKTLELSLFMEEYGLALDKGRQGKEKNRGIQTNWGGKKFKGVPIFALIKTIKKSGLQSKIKGSSGRFISTNQIAFMIQNAIKKNGITPRDFIQPALEEGDKVLNLHLDRDLLDILTKDLLVI